MRVSIEFIGQPEWATDWGSDQVPRAGDWVDVNGFGSTVKSVLWVFADGEAPRAIVRLRAFDQTGEPE